MAVTWETYAAQESGHEAVRAAAHLLTESRNTTKKGGRPAGCGRGRVKGSSELLGLDIPEKLQVDDFPGKMTKSVLMCVEFEVGMY